MNQNDEWETPQPLFDELDKEFHFNADPCASISNYKCPAWADKTHDGLSFEWTEWIEVFDNSGCNGTFINPSVFCNPPYSRGNIEKWVKKSYEESQKGCTVVMLLPVATGTVVWHDVIFPHASEIRFIRGRIKFTLNGVEKGTPRFDSAIVIFRPPVIQGNFKYASVRAK